MATQIFVNLPVTDLARAVTFYEALGFTPDEHMRDEKAVGMRVGDDIWVMLLTHPFFATFVDKPIADARTSTAVITAITAESDQAVDDLAERALAAGATPGEYRAEMPGMHGRVFADPDGHQWEVFHTDPALFGG